MALGQSGLLALLGELELADVTDRIRVTTKTLHKELTDAEVAAVNRAAPVMRSMMQKLTRSRKRSRSITC
jgi:hypothetical protein